MSKSSWIVGLLGLGLAANAAAAELRIFAAGAVQHAVLATKDAFERTSGHKIVFDFGTVGALRDRLLAGESADATILSTAGIGALEKGGVLRAGTSAAIGSTGPAIAYRVGAPMPDVSTPETLKAALLATKSIAYGDPSRGATAGIHFSKVIEALGIADMVRAKSHLVPFGVDGIERVARGESELAVSQATEILANSGVYLAGSFPPPYRISTGYAAAPIAASKALSAAEAYIRFLASPATIAAFRANGFVDR